MKREDYYKVDEIKVYRDMIQACIDHDIEKLQFLMLDQELNGQHLVSFNPRTEDSILGVACAYSRLDILKMFFDPNQVKHGVFLNDQVLAEHLGFSCSFTQNIYIVEELVQHYQKDIEKNNYTNKYFMSFLESCLKNCIEKNNVTIFSHIFHQHQLLLDPSFDYKLYQKIMSKKSTDIAVYLFNSPYFQPYFVKNKCNFSELKKCLTDNDDFFQAIMSQTKLFKRADVWELFTSKHSEILQALDKVELNKKLNNNLSSQEEKNKPKL